MGGSAVLSPLGSVLSSGHETWRACCPDSRSGQVLGVGVPWGCHPGVLSELRKSGQGAQGQPGVLGCD